MTNTPHQKDLQCKSIDCFLYDGQHLSLKQLKNIMKKNLWKPFSLLRISVSPDPPTSWVENETGRMKFCFISTGDWLHIFLWSSDQRVNWLIFNSVN